MAVIERCGDCHFFDKKEQECRAKAPTAFVMPSPSPIMGGMPQPPTILGIWPSTRETYWCGEFKPKRELMT